MKILVTDRQFQSIVNNHSDLLGEQRISDLPQNQQTSASPRPNIGSTAKPKPQLTAKQQQDVKSAGKAYDKANPKPKPSEGLIDSHTLNTILAIGTAFIPVVGPFISAGISLYDAAQYYNEGDTKTAGLVAMFSLIPGAGAVVAKIPGVKQLGAAGMKTLATKLASNAKLTKLESEVAQGLAANQTLVQKELSTITSNTAKKAAEVATKPTTKQTLANIGKKGLVFTATNVAPYAAAGVAYDKAYDAINSTPNDTPQVDLETINVADVSDANKQAALNIEF
jgi:hypothetical protein